MPQMLARAWKAEPVGVRTQIQELLLDDDVHLLDEAPPWVIALRSLYEAALLAAAVASAWLLVANGRWVEPAAWAIWAWFATDYLVRLYVADDRRHYVGHHRLELLAALPLDFARPLRAIRLLRPLAILSRSTKGLRDVLGLEGLTLIGCIGVAVVGVGGVLFAEFEGQNTSLGDGLWWAIVTTTTVGYGDISPVSTEGRVLAGVLMVAGIGLLGSLTAEIAQKLLLSSRPESTGNAQVDHVIARLHGWESLASDERRRLVTVLDALTDGDHLPSEKDRFEPEAEPRHQGAS